MTHARHSLKTQALRVMVSTTRHPDFLETGVSPHDFNANTTFVSGSWTFTFSPYSGGREL